ncbi:hypothetical protein [Carboxydothermus pertinax]|nr:hypothetical protein [Carboxydothermus pertinax]
MKTVIIMAAKTYTPISFWLSMPVLELIDWLEAIVEVAPGKERD